MYRNSERSTQESLVLVPNNVFYLCHSCASFKNTSEMAKVKSFDCQLQISKSTTLLQMNVKLYAVLLLFLFVSRPFARSKSKKELKLFSKATKDAQITVLQCHVLIIYFLQQNHDADRRPLVLTNAQMKQIGV